MASSYSPLYVCIYVCIFQDSSNTQAVACRLSCAVLLFLFLLLL